MCSDETFRKWAEEVSDIDIASVCDDLGIEVRKGSILCPDPGHNDTHYGSCKLYHNRYTCFACGAKGSVINLVEHTLNCSWREAADYIAGKHGLPSYKEAVKHDKSNNKPKVVPLTKTFTNEQLHFLGLKTNPSKVYTVTGMQEFKPKDGKGLIPGIGLDNEYCIGTSTSMSLQNLWEEDPEAVNEIVKGKAKEAIVKYLNIYNSDEYAQYPEIKAAARYALSKLEPVFDRFGITNYKVKSKPRYSMHI